MDVSGYLNEVNKQFRTGIAKEHAYRGYLKTLLESILPGIIATNEPKRVACGSPDYVLTEESKEIPIGYIEAKDINEPLEGKKHKEQFDRYRAALPNLIITDYLDFHFYREGELTVTVRIADFKDGKIIPKTDTFDTFTGHIKDFATFIGQSITSSERLAKLMAGKARLLANIIHNALDSDEQSSANNALYSQYEGFRQTLIHDIDTQGFADIYAQTIAYGMFAARLHDPTLETFSREEAAKLIPTSNPFLRKLFQYIAANDLDERIVWVVDSLVEVFLATNVASLMAQHGKATQRQDPVIHFYETFLAEYDSKLRKARGVWYTPQPVVNFIVRAVDDILKTEFGLAEGLADGSKTTIKVDMPTVKGKGKERATKMVKIEKEVHRVQILDPACGTGTFLAEAVKHIYKDFESMPGVWPQYVKDDLIPRLNGFEILMASYAMAHLKMDMLLRETGFEATGNQRFNIYLTNALEEHHPDTATLFASWLSDEAQSANYIKRDTPVMVVMGNPPYSGHSANKGEWIEGLLDDYKQEPGGGKLQEKNPKWLNDDYVKFIRYGQFFIEKNNEGVLAYISNNGFLDNPTFRGMRWHLLTTFDKIYVIDLHGSSKKKETAPDGSKDENVFDIQQGVSINLFVKTGAKKKGHLAKVLHCDLYGSRKYKYEYLVKHNLQSLEFFELLEFESQYFFIPRNLKLKKQYDEGFYLPDLFLVQSMGVTTGSDSEYVSFLKSDFPKEFDFEKIKPYLYRPFDSRFVYYDTALLARSRTSFVKHISNDNISFAFIKRSRNDAASNYFLVKGVVDKCIISSLDNANIFPLYLAEDSLLEGKTCKVSNLVLEAIEKIGKRASLSFLKDSTESSSCFNALNLFDYIYAILGSQAYLAKYREFLKIDFPRVPYPSDRKMFWDLAKLGSELRQLHLLESTIVSNSITPYPKAGNNIITRKIVSKDWELYDPEKKLGRIWINDEQYFDAIPLIAWEFYIGGYQPAQKWLKDRSGRTLVRDDIRHYQKIIVALKETDRIMQEIDKVWKP